MTKFVSGLLIGFFLAVGLMGGLVQIYGGPYYETVKTSQPYAQGFYNLAHTNAYAETQAFVAKVNETAAEVAKLPLIGGAFDAAKVSQYTQVAIDALRNAKSSSEVMLQLITTTKTLLELAMPAIILSLIMIGVGYWTYMEADGKDDAAKPAKKGRR